MSDVQFPAAVQDGSGGFGIGATGRCRQQQRGDQSQCFAGQAHTIIPSVSSRQSEQRFRTAAEVMFRNNILIIQQTFRYFQRKAVMRKIFPIFFFTAAGQYAPWPQQCLRRCRKRSGAESLRRWGQSPHRGCLRRRLRRAAGRKRPRSPCRRDSASKCRGNERRRKTPHPFPEGHRR